MPNHFHHYDCLVTAGPGMATAHVAIAYKDEDGTILGYGGGNLIAFGATWRDVAEFVRRDAEKLRLFSDVCTSVSPHLDLT